jgi:hypothetical protein
LPAGESCSEVIVLAVRFQNLVSFASALIGSKAEIRIIKAVRLAIFAPPGMLRRIPCFLVKSNRAVFGNDDDATA